MHKIFSALFALAMLAVAVPVGAQTYPPRTDANTATLEGSPADWAVIYNDGATLLFQSSSGATRSGKPYVMFKSQVYRVEARRFVPQFALPAASGIGQADIDRARAEGRAEGVAAARAALAGVR